MWLIIAILFSLVGLFWKSLTLLFIASLFLAWFFISLLEKEGEARMHLGNMLVFLWEAYWWIMARVEKLIVFLWRIYKKAFKGGYGKGLQYAVWAGTYFFVATLLFVVGGSFRQNETFAQIGILGGWMLMAPFFALAAYIFGFIGWQVLTGGNSSTKGKSSKAKKRPKKARA